MAITNELEDIPNLECLLIKLDEAKKRWQVHLNHTGPGESLGKAYHIDIINEINRYYPEYFKNKEEEEIQQAIYLLKSKGYKISKEVTTITYEEI